MKSTEVEKHSPSRGHKHICVPFESEAHYQECVEDVAKYREYLMKLSAQHPELFPQEIGGGYTFHDIYRSRKQGVVLRRIKLKASGEVFTVRPSFVLPYLTARTEEVEKALFLRQWGVPFWALAAVFGRDAMFWYRVWRSFGRPNLVGTTVKRAETMPRDLVADEKITWLAGEEVVVPTTVGGGCVLGISVAVEATSDSLEEAYFPALDPQDQGALPRGVAPPSTGSDLARVSGGHQGAVRATPAAVGRVGRGHARRWGGRDGPQVVSAPR
jgi:hypothetical protein